MPEVRFRLPPSKTPLDDAFGGMPARVRAYMRTGFANLASLTDEQRTRLVRVLVARATELDDVQGSALARELNLDEELVSPAAAAVSLLAAHVADRTDAPAALAEAFVSAKVADPPQAGLVAEIAQHLVGDRSRLAQSFDRQVLAQEVLPAFQGLDSTVDVRLRFVDGAVSLAIPVALVYLATDDVNSRVWFQATKGDVVRMIDDLRRVLIEMEGAEKWAQTK